MRWVLALVGLLGCFEPHPLAGTPCSPANTCPAPLTCDHGTCEPTSKPGDAAIDVLLPGVDTDGDGKLDVEDNCPSIANANQHDEDGDLRGDVCDGCPHVAQTTFANSDGDGVDDACDPYPVTPGEVIVRFEPFVTLPTDLTLTGNWQLLDDEVLQTTGNASLLVPGTSTNVTAEMGGRITAISSTSRELKIVAGRTAQNVWTSCCFDDTDPSPYVFEIEDEAGTVTNVLAAPNRVKMVVGPFMIRATALAGAHTIACTANENGTPRTASANAPALTAGQIQVFSRNTSFTLQYLIVIRSP